MPPTSEESRSSRTEPATPSHSEPLSYAAAGVDIDEGERAFQLMRPAISAGALANRVGAFGAAVASPGADMLLVSSADGVGTKLCLARTDQDCAGLGRDLVHHCINDILTCGARPLFFLDYLAFARLDPERAAAIVHGMSLACQAHGCALVGGETAELPDIYREGAFDVAGFIVGAVARSRCLDGSAIQAGDALVGLPSSGLHTNGFTLARHMLANSLNRSLHELIALTGDSNRRPQVHEHHAPTVREALLAEHLCYRPSIGSLLDSGKLLGMAHITGGGLPGNVPRMLPEGLAAELWVDAWVLPPIFELLRSCGTSSRELYRTFNMGIGMVAACRSDMLADVVDSIPSALHIGNVVPDTGAGRVLGLW